MKRRRGRRGFWWWSWLLLLTAIGGTFGGAFFGKQQWESAEKDYPSIAVVKAGIRTPFKASKVEVAPSGVANVNEAQVKREVESHEGIAPVVAALDLSQRWGVGTDEAISMVRSSLDLDLSQEDKEILVTVIRPDPIEAAELANAIAEAVPGVIKSLDEANQIAGQESLAAEIAPYAEVEAEAKAELKKALESIKVKLDPKPGIDLNVYMEVPAVRDAKVLWDSAYESKAQFELGQREFERYWDKPIKPSFVVSKAEPALNFTGPELQPFQMQFGLYGLTLGLFGGLLLMAIFWKLLP